jgi:hypothetical protein
MFGGHKRKVVVNTNDGPRAVSMVEGAGVFICHRHEFLTQDKAKFDAHIREEGHVWAIGSTGNCVMCNKSGVDLTGKQVGENPICDNCILKLGEQQREAQKRLAEMRKR